MPDDTDTDAETEKTTRPRLSDETAKRLFNRMGPNESYDDAIVRLLDMADEMEDNE